MMIFMAPENDGMVGKRDKRGTVEDDWAGFQRLTNLVERRGCRAGAYATDETKSKAAAPSTQAEMRGAQIRPGRRLCNHDSPQATAAI
jgi:hypothetical protein